VITDADMAGLLQARQRAVPGVRLGARQRRPADHAARPVTAAQRVVAAKFRALHRRLAAPHAVFIAIARNAGCGR
jgi:hypothetical protein